jgi:hypothetical protein
MTQGFRRPHGSGCGEFGQACRFGFKHRQAGRAINLDEEDPLAVADAPRRVDAAAVERLPLTNSKGLAGDGVNMLFNRGPNVGYRTSREQGWW